MNLNLSVLYDYQCFMSPYGGNPQYIAELVNGLNYNPMLPWDFKTCNVYYHDLTKKPIYKLSQNKYSNYAKHFGYGYLNRKRCCELLSKGEFDVFHPTYYNPYFLQHLHGKPYVVMVPDMTHEIFPYLFGNAQEVIRNKAIVMEHAEKVIAITENTKRDIVTLGGIEESKVVVIPLATSLLKVEPTSESLRYILFVGNRWIYKNFDMFARVVASIMKSDHGLHLVCAGGGKFTESERCLLESLGISNRTHYKNIDGNLNAIYSNAELFVFPSLYEGFGIPTLEAMACGCPVCCSNTSSFPEVAGNAAMFFNPYDASDMKRSIETVLYNQYFKDQLISYGFVQSKKFSWDETRKQTAAVYRGCCGL